MSFPDRIRSFVNRRVSKREKKGSPVTQAPDGAASVEPSTSQEQKPLQAQPPQQPQQNQLQDQSPRVFDKAAVVATSQAATVTGQLQVALINNSNSNQVFAYISKTYQIVVNAQILTGCEAGLAIDRGNAVFLLQSDARTPYYPGSPSQTGAAIGANVGINLGAPGNTVTATIPRLAGARIWFSIGKPLVFKLNPGPGLVEPSVFNPADPNYNTNFGFCEFTFNSAQVFANITYVDFVSDVPIALTLYDTAGRSQHVSGMRTNGLATVCKGLRAQSARDGRLWKALIVEKDGKELRALSPNSGIIGHPDWFETYYTQYVNKVWQKFTSRPLTIDTQASWGAVQGRVNAAGLLDFGDGSTFAKPSTADIFSNSSGPFATGGNAKTNAIIPRLAAAFNRSLLLHENVHETPNGTSVKQFYTAGTTNHYAKIVHAANVDGLGYAFPYDDVVANGGRPQEGAIFSFSPTKLSIGVGGTKAHAA